jgi:hypothetical protein
MTGILIGDVVPALDNPELTETKLGRQWGEAIDWDHVADTLSEPSMAEAAPLDKAALAATVGPAVAYAPQWVTGSFRVPYGMREAQLEALCKEMATRWFDEMRRRGWDLASGTQLAVNPGPNPSIDIASGLSIPGHRDYLLSAQFVERHPQTVRVEVPGELFDPYRPRQLETSSGDDEGD